MDFSGFYHEMKSNYAYAVSVSRLHLRLRTGAGAAEGVSLIIFDPYNWVKRADNPEVYVFNEEKCQRLPMRREYTAEGFDYWFVEAQTPTKRAQYAFIAEAGGETYLYGHHYAARFDAAMPVEALLEVFYRFPYILQEDIFHAPDWVKDTVWYQIFPERYAHSGKVWQKDTLLPWGMAAAEASRPRYGGDLAGVIAHLADLQALGVTGIYFTPLFKSPSTHKYDTADYFQIDPAFGDNALFAELVRQAHKRGIRIMLDLVFNHIGNTHPFWQDVLANGKNSRYYTCFYIKTDFSGDYDAAAESPYETFATVPTMPKWNTSDPFARRYLLDAALYWARTYEVDGFRLDVANEVSHDFWRTFRREVRAVNPDLYIVGEVWEHASPWLMGDQFDAVMNYPLARCIWRFVSGKTDGEKLAEELSAYLVSYPKNRQTVMFNLVGSHDTSRILTIAKENPQRLMQGFVLLFSFAGSPCVYYGDEVGMTGEGPDRARGCMVWDKARQNLAIYEFLRQLIALRKRHPAMRSPELRWLKSDKEGVIYLKQQADERIAVLLNGQDKAITITLPAALTGQPVRDLRSARDITPQNTLLMAPYDAQLWLMPPL